MGWKRGPIWVSHIKAVQDRHQPEEVYHDVLQVLMVPDETGDWRPAVLMVGKGRTRTVTESRRESSDTD
jgi:hypothetical protein